MDNGKDEPESDHASKEEAVAENKAQTVRGVPLLWERRKVQE